MNVNAHTASAKPSFLERMKPSTLVMFIAMISAIGGLIYGYDTGVIGTAC